MAVLDAADRRFIPLLDVTLTVSDARGKEISRETLPFLWHPGRHHHGKNGKPPGDDDYILRVHVAAPTFHRHDKVHGRRYAEPAVAVFKNIAVNTGRDRSTMRRLPRARPRYKSAPCAGILTATRDGCSWPPS